MGGAARLLWRRAFLSAGSKYSLLIANKNLGGAPVRYRFYPRKDADIRILLFGS
jgi:hypothetical protein